MSDRTRTAGATRLPAPHPLARKLGRAAPPLSDEEARAGVAAWAGARTRFLRAGEDLIREGDRPLACSLVLDGVLCRYKLPGEDKRQITAFLVAGDLCELDGLIAGRMDHGVAALTPATVAALTRPAFDALVARRPGIARALWQDTLAEAAVAREWVANVGRRSAYQRVAHLLCELRLRLGAAGLADEDGFAWPVTQAELADATGLSTVHVNRVLQQLRAEGLIALGGREIRISDWVGLRQAAGFASDYLRLDPDGGLGADGGAGRGGAGRGRRQTADGRRQTADGHSSNLGSIPALP